MRNRHRHRLPAHAQPGRRAGATGASAGHAAVFYLTEALRFAIIRRSLTRVHAIERVVGPLSFRVILLFLSETMVSGPQLRPEHPIQVLRSGVVYAIIRDRG